MPDRMRGHPWHRQDHQTFRVRAQQHSRACRLLAVGLAESDHGRRIGDSYRIPRRYDGYEQVVRDPDIDIVYVGTPTVYHERDVSMCLDVATRAL